HDQNCRQAAFQPIIAVENKGPGVGSPFAAEQVPGKPPPMAPDAMSGLVPDHGRKNMNYLDKSALRVVGTRPIRPDGVDKVPGRANFGADMTLPGMLWGRIKRSPHAHARIVSINTDKAMALPGVKAVTTRADFPDIPPDRRVIGAAPHNLWDLSRNCMATGKALYEGHAVAAVAATTPAIAE